MKSEQEIRDQIKELKSKLDVIASQHIKRPNATLFYQTQIGILEWVLRD